jgi:hypothetical protein
MGAAEPGGIRSRSSDSVEQYPDAGGGRHPPGAVQRDHEREHMPTHERWNIDAAPAEERSNKAPAP